MKERKRVTKRSRKAKAKSISLRASAEEGALGRPQSVSAAGSGPASQQGRRGRAGIMPSREWILKYRAYYRPRKVPVTLRLDADVLAWFKKKGRGYQTRINRALRALMLEERRHPESDR